MVSLHKCHPHNEVSESLTFTFLKYNKLQTLLLHINLNLLSVPKKQLQAPCTPYMVQVSGWLMYENILWVVSVVSFGFIAPFKTIETITCCIIVGWNGTKDIYGQMNILPVSRHDMHYDLVTMHINCCIGYLANNILFWNVM